jgi:signal transduction histidine kinase/phage shock protein PspC (stress-responsive transcriptional regulator)
VPEASAVSNRNLPNRSTNDRVVAGVCAGLARAVGVDPPVVRIAAIVLGITGTGALLYLIGWLILPPGVTPEPEGADASEVRRGLGLGLIVLGVVLTQDALGLGFPPEVVWPVVVVGLGVGVVVWQVQPQLEATRTEAFRIAAGILVVGAGITALIAGNVSFEVIRSSLLATTLVLGGVALIVGPWMAVLMRERAEERRRRLHADARADMAAHLHDSVLQTFALIQRTDDPKVIAQLARQQERELRRWLYADSDDPAATTVKNAVDRVAGVVEDRFDVAVQTVVVGDVALDTTLEALMGAMGEAATNAAKWSGCDQVSVFAEVEDDGVRVFVRDTGAGFDPEAVAEDRLGLRESIIGRMERVGGTVDIRSSPGDGTEVELFAPLVGAVRRDTV